MLTTWFIVHPFFLDLLLGEWCVPVRVVPQLPLPPMCSRCLEHTSRCDWCCASMHSCSALAAHSPTVANRQLPGRRVRELLLSDAAQPLPERLHHPSRLLLRPRSHQRAAALERLLIGPESVRPRVKSWVRTRCSPWARTRSVVARAMGLLPPRRRSAPHAARENTTGACAGR